MTDQHSPMPGLRPGEVFWLVEEGANLVGYVLGVKQASAGQLAIMGRRLYPYKTTWVSSDHFPVRLQTAQAQLKVPEDLSGIINKKDLLRASFPSAPPDTGTFRVESRRLKQSQPKQPKGVSFFWLVRVDLGGYSYDVFLLGSEVIFGGASRSMVETTMPVRSRLYVGTEMPWLEKFLPKPGKPMERSDGCPHCQAVGPHYQRGWVGDPSQKSEDCNTCGKSFTKDERIKRVSV